MKKNDFLDLFFKKTLAINKITLCSERRVFPRKKKNNNNNSANFTKRLRPCRTKISSVQDFKECF